MSTSDKNAIDAREIPLEQLSEIAGGVADIPEHRQEPKEKGRQPRGGGNARPI